VKGTKAEEKMEALNRLPDTLLDAVEEINPISFRTFSSAGSEHLPYKQWVGVRIGYNISSGLLIFALAISVICV